MRKTELMLNLVNKIEGLYERLLTQETRFSELLAKYESALLDHPIVNELVKCANELDQVKELSADPRGFAAFHVNGEQVDKDSFDQVLADAVVPVENSEPPTCLFAHADDAGGGGSIPFVMEVAKLSDNSLVFIEPSKQKEPKPPKAPRDTFHNKCSRCKLPKPSRWLDKETQVCTTCKKNEDAGNTIVPTAEPAKYVKPRSAIATVPPRDFEQPNAEKRKPITSIKALHEELLLHFRDTSTFSIDTVMEFAGCDLGQARAYMSEMVNKQAAQKIPGASERFRIKVWANMDDYWALTMPSRESGHVEF